MKPIPANFPIAVHPGDVLQEVLADRGVTQSALARHIKVDPSKINEICRRRRGVSAEMALVLGKAFSVSPALWLNLQANWELSQADRSVAGKIRPLRIGA